MMEDITQKLDKIATHLELKGHKKLAATLDVVSNELDKIAADEQRIAMEERKAAFLQGITQSALSALPDSISTKFQELIDEKFRSRGQKIDLGKIDTVAIEENPANPSGVVIMMKNGEAVEPLDAHGNELPELKELINLHGRGGKV